MSTHPTLGSCAKVNAGYAVERTHTPTCTHVAGATLIVCRQDTMFVCACTILLYANHPNTHRQQLSVLQLAPVAQQCQLVVGVNIIGVQQGLWSSQEWGARGPGRQQKVTRSCDAYSDQPLRHQMVHLT